MLRQVSQPKCYPISLAQARKHLAVDSSDRSNDSLINLLIESATADSEMKTGRKWVECDWEWQPCTVSPNYEVEFPIVPVKKVALYDLDEFSRDDEPVEPENPEEPDIPEPPEIEEPEESTKRKRIKRDNEEEDNGNSEDDTPPEYTDIANEYIKVNYPSPEPLGSPQIGSMVPLKEFPKNYRLVLTVGYPVKAEIETAEQFDNPVLVPEKTGYSDSLIRLVFNRPVQGNININNFEIRFDGEILTLVNAYFRDGCVELQYTMPDTPPPMEPEEPDEGGENEDNTPEIQGLPEGAKVTVSFFEGAIYDEFQNFVQPIVETQLPEVMIISPEYFELPEPIPKQEVYESLAPSPIKNWILTRVGSLYSQRTEIALRAGKSNDAMFPNEFINNLLNPYIVRFLG